jgi:hypothetical protein
MRINRAVIRRWFGVTFVWHSAPRFVIGAAEKMRLLAEAKAIDQPNLDGALVTLVGKWQTVTYEANETTGVH